MAMHNGARARRLAGRRAAAASAARRLRRPRRSPTLPSARPPYGRAWSGHRRLGHSRAPTPGRACRSRRRRPARCAGRHRRDPDAWSGTREGHQPSSATPACSTAASTARARTTPTTRRSPPRSTRPVGSEDCLYLNIWRPASGDDEPAGDRLHPRRQQRLGLHRRPGLRRRRAREGGQRGRRHAPTTASASSAG